MAAGFVAAQRTGHGVPHAVACRALGVAPSTFCGWRGRPPAPAQRRGAEVDALVKACFDASGGAYGSPRVRAQLRRDGLAVSKRTVEAPMARQGLQGRSPRRRRRGPARPGKAAAPAPGLLRRDSSAKAPGQRWCGDFKQAHTDEGPVFLAAVEDLVCGDVASNPVPKGLASRRGGQRAVRGVPLIRAPRTLPRVIDPAVVDAFIGALRKHRDRAMVDAMLLGGLRRCEVLGLRFEDINAGERRVFIADGKGGHQRVVPVSSRFFDSLAAYLCDERPTDTDTDRVFVVLKGPRRGRPLSAAGLDEIVASARRRAGIEALTCHQLRHTCFTRLREAGMALEAIQAQAGHRSIESARIYLHLANDWLAGEYRRATEAIDAQTLGEW